MPIIDAPTRKCPPGYRRDRNGVCRPVFNGVSPCPGQESQDGDEVDGVDEELVVEQEEDAYEACPAYEDD